MKIRKKIIFEESEDDGAFTVFEFFLANKCNSKRVYI